MPRMPTVPWCSSPPRHRSITRHPGCHWRRGCPMWRGTAVNQRLIHLPRRQVVCPDRRPCPLPCCCRRLGRSRQGDRGGAGTACRRLRLAPASAARSLDLVGRSVSRHALHVRGSHAPLLPGAASHPGSGHRISPGRETLLGGSRHRIRDDGLRLLTILSPWAWWLPGRGRHGGGIGSWLSQGQYQTGSEQPPDPESAEACVIPASRCTGGSGTGPRSSG